MKTTIPAATRASHRDAPAKHDLDPIFLLGAARSGTSLLYKVMALHPQTTWLSNWVQRFPDHPQLAALNRTARVLPERRARVWFGPRGDNAYVYGSKRRLRDRVFPMPAEAESFYHRRGVPEPAHEHTTAEPDVVDRLRVAFATVSRWDGGRVLLTKRIANNRRVPLLSEAFPGARFVEIVRDGRAVAASLSKVDWWEDSIVWWYGGTPADWRRAGGDPWELCARNWVEEVCALRRGLGSASPAQVLSIRYEDLVADPGATLQELLSFCGIDPCRPAWQRSLAAVRFPDQNQAWQTGLPASALAVIESVQRGELARYGYL